MFEAPQCALKSNQPSGSGTNCKEKMSENASSLALSWRCVLLWWHRGEVISGLSQAQSPLLGRFIPVLAAVGSWCGMPASWCFLQFSACASQHLQDAVQKPCLCVIRAGLEGCFREQRLLPSYQIRVCIKKKKNSTKGNAGLCL